MAVVLKIEIGEKSDAMRKNEKFVRIIYNEIPKANFA